MVIVDFVDSDTSQWFCLNNEVQQNTFRLQSMSTLWFFPHIKIYDFITYSKLRAVFSTHSIFHWPMSFQKKFSRVYGPSKSTSICFTNLVHKQINKEHIYVSWLIFSVPVYIPFFFLVSVKQIGRESVFVHLVWKFLVRLQISIHFLGHIFNDIKSTLCVMNEVYVVADPLDLIWSILSPNYLRQINVWWVDLIIIIISHFDRVSHLFILNLIFITLTTTLKP